jgi:hypothetical protein
MASWFGVTSMIRPVSLDAHAFQQAASLHRPIIHPLLHQKTKLHTVIVLNQSSFQTCRLRDEYLAERTVSVFGVQWRKRGRGGL